MDTGSQQPSWPSIWDFHKIKRDLAYTKFSLGSPAIMTLASVFRLSPNQSKNQNKLAPAKVGQLSPSSAQFSSVQQNMKTEPNCASLHNNSVAGSVSYDPTSLPLVSLLQKPKEEDGDRG